MKNRDVVRTLISGCLAITWVIFSIANGQTIAPPRPEVHRPTVMLNMAADALVDYLRTEQPLDAGVSRTMIVDGLHDMVDQYKETNVTHLLFNIGYHRTAYRSNVWEAYWDDKDPDSYLSGWPRKYWLIHQHDLDPFSTVITRCREMQISPWVSIRMNDTHHLTDPSRASRLWIQHPELRLRKTGGFDFAHPEVREHYLALIEELARRYDVDGIELDWMRYAEVFKQSEARSKGRVLTEFMRTAREVLKSASKDRGYPVHISVRVPARPEFAEGLGIDAVSWVQDELVDILVPCSTWNPSYPDVPVESWRKAIGNQAQNYLLAPGTDLWISGAQPRPFMQSNMETMRGFSCSMLDRGADAIYLFNHFARTDSKIWYLDANGARQSRNTMSSLLNEAGSLQKSMAKPRRHILTNHDPIAPDSNYQKPLPTILRPNQPSHFSIHLGPKPVSGRVSIRVGLKSRQGYESSKLTAKFNGVDCGPLEDMTRSIDREPQDESWRPILNVAAIAPRVMTAEAPLSAVSRGYNKVSLSLSTSVEQEVIWLECLVTP